MAFFGLFGGQGGGNEGYSLNGSAMGTGLQRLLMCNEIQPGSAPSYETCKIVYSFHPLGKKMVDSPIAKAQSQQREISIPAGPEERIRNAFLEEWRRLRADKRIANVAKVARIYGIGTIAVVVGDEDTARPLDFKTLHTKTVSFNVLDPLNTSGSSTLNQDPNAAGFQRTAATQVSGQAYHPSRTCVLLNEDPLYIEYTASGFGYVGRSVYQRALYPLKSFVQTMRTDDLVTRKAGVLVAKMQFSGAIVDNVVQKVAGQKREVVKLAMTDDVLSIGAADDISSLNLQNLDAPYALARKNIIENVASAADMPAIMLNSETFAEGFGEGTEDSKNVAAYVDGVRADMGPAYDFMDAIVQRRAWNPDFYVTIQADFPDQYADVAYEVAFYQWSNSFTAVWPSLLVEPDSEKIKVDDVKLKAVIALLEVLLPVMDPENRVATIQWACDNFNALKLLFPVLLELDYDALESYEPPQPLTQGQEPGEPKPFAAADSVRALNAAVARLPVREARRDRAGR